MISIIILNKINEIQSEINDKYKVIKAIDFSKEIDTDRSDEYVIDNEHGYLRFLYRDMKVVRSEDYSLVNGRMLVKDAGVELVPTFNDMTDNKYKRAHIMTSKGFRLNQIDVIKIDIQLEDKSSFFIMINNKSSQQLFEKQKRKEIFLSSKDYDTPKRRVFSYQLGADLIVRKFEGLTEKLKVTVPFNYEKNVKLRLNLKDGYAVIGEQKRLIPKVDFDTNEELYVSLVFNSEITVPYDKKVLIDSMKLCRDNGLIYLKPQKLQENRAAKVFMIYKGAPVLQYYSDMKNKWIDISNEQQLAVSNLSQLRVAMANGDQILSLMIVEEGDLICKR